MSRPLLGRVSFHPILTRCAVVVALLTPPPGTLTATILPLIPVETPLCLTPLGSSRSRRNRAQENLWCRQAFPCPVLLLPPLAPPLSETISLPLLPTRIPKLLPATFGVVILIPHLPLLLTTPMVGVAASWCLVS